MFEDAFKSMPKKYLLFGGLILLGPFLILFLMGLIFLDAEPIEESAVLGCYVAADAPPLDVTSGKIRIVDGSNRSFSFVTDVKPKLGYHLSVKPALRPALDQDGHFRFRNAPGIGYFWRLLTADSDNPRKLRSPDQFGGRFALYSSDGHRIIYTKSADQDACLLRP